MIAAEPPNPETRMVPLAAELDRDHKKMFHEKLGVFEKGFTLGVLTFCITLVCLSRCPQYFWLWHLAKGCIYIPWRFYRFLRRDLEWYLLDFCYFVTYFTVVGCALAFVHSFLGHGTFLARFNCEFLRAGFSFANGALVMSVPLFGNKIVFHDVDNTTSLYIHLSPALLFWSLRWGGGFGTSLIEMTWPGMFHICANMTEADLSVTDLRHALWYSGDCQGTVAQFAMWPGMIWFICWGVPYYLITFCCFKKFLEDRPGKKFLYRDTLKDSKGTGRFVCMVPECFRPLVFMFQHFLWVVFAGFCSIILWNSFILHTSFLAAIFLFALHNGSTYMFRVVAARTVQNELLKTVNAMDTDTAAHAGVYEVVVRPAEADCKGEA